MSIRTNITAIKFPEQGRYLNARVEVCFHYDASQSLKGQMVRDDAEGPWVGIIKLDNGRYVLTSECQWRPEDI